MSARVRNMTQIWGMLQDVGVALARVFEMMAKLPEEKVGGGDHVPAAPSNAFAFDNVSFSYDHRSRGP